jgi:hypothetical protein
MAEPTNALADYDLPDLDLPMGVAVVGGALLGGLAGFLLLTARGARARHDIALVVERMFDGVDTLLASLEHVQHRAAEARRVMGKNEARGSGWPGEGLS